MDGRVKPGHDEMRAPSPAPSITRILHQIPVIPLFADVVFLVVAMALGGVERTAGRAAGALVALVVFGRGFYGVALGFCHRRSPSRYPEKTLTVQVSFPEIENS
jgi:hypothetical protein